MSAPAAVMGLVLVRGEMRQLPKWGMTLDEVQFAMGSEDLVRSLRSIGALMPAKRTGQTLIFDTGAAANVWARYLNGEYDDDLAKENEARKGKRRVPRD